MSQPDVSEELIQETSDILHQITWRLRVDQLETWSHALKGVTQLDMHILKLIAEQPDIILKEICDTLRIPNSTLTSAINRLEKRGLLNRLISKRDRRSYELELTEEGHKLKQEHDRVDRMIAMRVLEALDDVEQMQQLVNMLTAVVERFE